MKLKQLVFLCVALVAMASLSLPGQANAQNVNDFTIQSFTADYYLSKDSEGRSQLRVKEQIVADFPDTDQNHGILRAIPQTYDGHTVDLRITSVTKQNGQAANYTTYQENDNLVLKIGDADRFVHGEQTYNIAYKLRDVIKQFDDHDEFFWDINGTQWQQPFERVAARIHIPAQLATRFNEQTRCYTGEARSTQAECIVNINNNPGKTVVTVDARRSLAPGENMSIVLAFEPGTFQPYRMEPWQLAALVLMAAASLAIPAAAFMFMWRKWRVHGSDPKGRGVIIPEYAPPENINPVLADIILNERFSTKAISATVLGLCVKKYLKLYEHKKDKLFGDSTEYELELVQKPAKLSKQERAVISMLFGARATVGSKVNLSGQKNKLYKQAQALQKSANKAVALHGYFTASPKNARQQYIGWGVVLCVLGFIITFPLQVIFLGVGTIAAGIIVIVFSNIMPARTQKGVATKEHLLGLKDYMQLAEAERIRVLQSPKGAQRTPVKALQSKAELVKLYEQLLPYAMLFGIEKEWAKQFADMYDQPPDWYNGSQGFNAGAFAGAIGGLASASDASFTSPSSSSGSGFSGGGSGGGGGGGGGGGW